MDQSNGMYLERQPKGGFLKMLLMVIVVTAITGAGAWYYFNQKYNKESADLQTQIDALTVKFNAATAAATIANETTDWQTYLDSSCKVSMTYPATWTYNVLPDGLVNYKNSEKTYQYGGGSLAPVTYRCETDSFGANIDTFLASMKMDKAEYKNGTGTIGGQTSYLIDAVSTPSHQQFQVVFYGGKVHTFTNQAEDIASAASSGGQTDKTYIDGIYSQMLDSVVFSN